MIVELIRDYAYHIKKMEVPKNIYDFVKLQIENLELSAKAGKRKVKLNHKILEKLNLPDQIIQLMHNSASSVIYDWDDYLFAGHTGHSAVFTSKAFSNKEEEIIKATLLGNEIGGRIGILTLIGPLNGQMMTHLHGIISATVTEFLLGDINKIPQRVLLYLANPNFLTFGGFFEHKASTVISPILSGVLSSLFELSYSGIQSIEQEFFNLYSWGNSYKIAESLFSPDFFLTETLMIKKLPGCAYVLPQLESIISLKERIKREDGEFISSCIEYIQVEYSIIPAILDKIVSKFSGSAFAPQFSTPLCLAIALTDDSFSFTSYDKYENRKGDILRLLNKISLIHNKEFTRQVLESLRYIPIPDVSLSSLKKAVPRIADFFWLLKDSIIVGLNALTSLKRNTKINKENLQNLEFIFPVRILLKYKGKILEESRKTHSFRIKDKELISKFISQKEKMIISHLS